MIFVIVTTERLLWIRRMNKENTHSSFHEEIGQR
jgi:hypothetical protein